MAEFIDFLYRWQTLIGSILGGFFAFCVAFIVGHSVNRREDVSIGMLLVADLAKIRIVSEILKEKAQKDSIAEDQYSLWLAEKLTQKFPKLSPLFESSTVRMLPINTHLAAHLTLFHKIYIDIDETVAQLSQDFTAISKKIKPSRSRERILVDARLISKNFPHAIQHASCAEHLIAELVLSKVPTWNRFRQLICKKQVETECEKYLESSS